MIQKSQDNKFIDVDERNNPLMTLRTLKFYCEKESLPSQPQLNETLYLQYKGFQKIVPETISKFINIKTLYLNNNGILKLQGLHMLRGLSILHINNNFIEKIEGLEELYNLTALNIAHNKIDFVQGLEKLINLKTLNLSENFLTKSKDLEGLIPLINLSQLNLSQNELESSEEVFEMITELQNLTILYLKSTPLSNIFKNYRKRVIYELKKLKFLDNRPVLPRDHQLAEAWAQGGTQKQKQIKSQITIQKKQQQERALTDQFSINEDKMKQQKDKNILLEPIHYQKSERPLKNDGLNSAYLPKKMTKLEEFLESEVKNQNEFEGKRKQKKIEIEPENIYTKVEQILGNSKTIQQIQQNDVRIKKSVQKKWTRKYQPILQSLLMKYKFDFGQVQPSLNMIISNINKKLMKPGIRFEMDQLLHIWTDIQIRKRQQQLQRYKKSQSDLIIA